MGEWPNKITLYFRKALEIQVTASIVVPTTIIHWIETLEEIPPVYYLSAQKVK